MGMIQRGELPVRPEIFDLLFRSVDTLKEAMDAYLSGNQLAIEIEKNCLPTWRKSRRERFQSGKQNYRKNRPVGCPRLRHLWTRLRSYPHRRPRGLPLGFHPADANGSISSACPRDHPCRYGQGGQPDGPYGRIHGCPYEDRAAIERDQYHRAACKPLAEKLEQGAGRCPSLEASGWAKAGGESAYRLS